MARENKKTDKELKKASKERTKIDNSMFTKFSKSILSTIDDGIEDRMEIRDKNKIFQNIINKELDIARGVSGGNIIDSLLSIASDDDDRNPNLEDDIYDKGLDAIISKNSGDLFGYFKDTNKNKFLEIQDLNYISKFIPELGEAVKVTLDRIVTSDDMGDTITRKLHFKNTVDDNIQKSVIDVVTHLESSMDILKKLKNIVYKNALISGTYYVYAVSYRKLFYKYQKEIEANRDKLYTSNGLQIEKTKKDTKKKTKGASGLESVIFEASSYTDDINKELGLNTPTLKRQTKNYTDEFTQSLCNVYAVESSIPYDIIGQIESALENDQTGKNAVAFGEATVDEEDNKNPFDTNGTYLKYIPAVNMIPIKILDEIVGYYYIQVEKKNKPHESNLVSPSGLFSPGNSGDRHKESMIDKIVGSVTSKIIDKFSPQFIEQHSSLKKMIADCITANGFTDQDYRVQFIPAEDVIEFPVNVNEKGDGESMLSNSIFPAKLLLSLIICKMLNFMNKSGNKTLAHIHKGPINTSTQNQVMRVIRNIQESNITFNDLLSPNQVFSKFTRDANIAMPKTTSGNKLIEFEIMEGQNIDMNTPMEEKLMKMAITGTGVPSSLMESQDQVDFAREITTSNIKFAGRVASFQADFEDPTTKLYIKLIENSGLPTSTVNQCKKDFRYKLARPKVASSANSSDFIATAQNLATIIADVQLGSNKTPAMEKIKDEIIKELVMKYTPYLDWNEIESVVKEAKMENGLPESNELES